MSAGVMGQVAGGDIRPRRFVKVGATAGLVLECDADELVFGVSQSGTRSVPYGALADGLAAKVNENLRVFAPGEQCDIEAGDTFAIGALLKPDADGKAVAVTAAGGQKYGARALAACTVAGQFIPVRVEIGYVGVVDT